jgi:hypothetical protein
MTEQSPAEAIFFAALEKGGPRERADYLDAACGDDSDLRRRVERLLAAHPQVGSFLEQPARAEAGPHEAATIPPKGQAPPGLIETESYHGPSEGIGSLIAGRYKLLETLGQGGMGAVFMAQQIEPVKRLVALKLIKLGMDSRQVLTRFEAERQALALMDHPNIAKVLDAGATESGRPFFVMELVKGVPITRFCDERQLSPRERLELIIPVCQAIQHAHQKGIIHRDIKPTNVLIALYDDRPVPKVIDFGVAKAAGSQLTDATLVTGFGAIVGTPEYMSPEQAQLNQLDIDTRSDVYALGVLLYELLTGTTPIDRKRLKQGAVFEILRIIREEEPPRPSMRLSTSEVLPSIAATRKMEPAKLTRLMRGELDWIVMKCLEKDRSRRYEAANGLARDLERYLHDEVVDARPPSAGYRLRKFVRKHRPALAAAGTVMLLLVMGAAVSTWQAFRATRAERATARALGVAERNEQEANRLRHKAEEQRMRAEVQAASRAMDVDLKHCEDGAIAIGLLRMAETLRTIPDHAKELRECAALNILAWGQRLCPAIGPLNHDGFELTDARLSIDGQTVVTLGCDGTIRLWDSLTRKERAKLVDPAQKNDCAADFSGLIQFSQDGSTLLTLIGREEFREDDLARDLSAIVVSGGDHVVRLWNVRTGQLRMATAQHRGNVLRVRLSGNAALLATSCRSSVSESGPSTVFFWNGLTGKLIRELRFEGEFPWIEVSPDGRQALISRGGHFEVLLPEENRPQKRLPGGYAKFSASGKSAISVSKDAVYWWNTADWQLERHIPLLKGELDPSVGKDLVADDVLVIGPRIFARNCPNPILSYYYVPRAEIGLSADGLYLAAGTHIFDASSGQPLVLPAGRNYQPELSRFADDRRFALLPTGDLASSFEEPQSSLVDVAADKRILIRVSNTSFNEPQIRFLKTQETWIAIDAIPINNTNLSSYRLVSLRKADASVDSGLLQKWCEVVTRGKLDRSGRFTKFDETTWERMRLELAHLLDANPNAQSLRTAVSDPMYWLRQEIKDSSAPLALLGRLVAAEPTWPNYAQRAAVEEKERHWDLAIRDELEAARLAGERYWLGGSQINGYDLAFRAVQAPDRPREQYERARHWAEARTRAGVSYEQENLDGDRRRYLLAGLLLFRLGRYAEALAALRTIDRRFLVDAASMLMSPWSIARLVCYSPSPHGFELDIRKNVPDPVDLLVRAMCHHHLGHPKEARACLQQARGILAKNGNDAEPARFLHEAESLIEGEPRP